LFPTTRERSSSFKYRPRSPNKTALIGVVDSQPLNLTTLKITVAGGDLTSRFTVSATGASWTLGGGDDLAAGSLTISASIANALDEETTTSATVSVRPTFTSILPEAARVGDLVEIAGFGLSPDPAQNAAVFPRAASTPPIIVVPFETVAADLRSGTVRVPGGARTGKVSVRVNEVDSLESGDFYVKPNLLKCGNLEDFDHAANGDVYVLRLGADGAAEVLLESTPTRTLVASAVDKAGRTAAVLARVEVSGTYSPRVFWWRDGVLQPAIKLTGLSGFSGCCQFNFSLDFDTEGRLYFIGQGRLVRVPMPAEGAPVPETLAVEPFGPTYGGFDHIFKIGCDDQAYVASIFDLFAPPNYIRYEMSRVDLASGLMVARSASVDQRWAVDIDVSCRTDEVFVSQFSHLYGYEDVELARIPITTDPVSIRPPEPFAELFFVNDNPLIRVSPDGSLLTTQGDFSIGYRERIGGGRTLVTLDVPKLPGCGGTGPLAICPRQGITIVSDTGRWKPYRSPAPLRVVFRGPSEMDAASVKLEVVAPSEVGTYIPLISGFKRFKDPVTQQETPDKYEFEWQGPWTFPMLTGTVIEEAPLPFGNYTIKVRGKKTAASPELVSAVYTKVSLVAVTTVQLQTHVSPLDVNPNAGDGKRIFPEATQPAPNDDIGNRDMVRVVATTSPAVTDPGPSPQLPVSVFFRAIDVDDPSAAGDDVDKEESLKDNRADGEAGVGLTDVGQPGDVTAVGSTRPIAVGAAGGATAYFRVSKRQGDNYRVAASMDQAEIASFVPRNASLIGEVDTASGAPVTENITEMLTVWRTLHLEVSRLASTNPASDQTDLDTLGHFTRLSSSGVTDANSNFFAADHPAEDDWVGGHALLGPFPPFRVNANQRNSFSVDLAGNPPLDSPPPSGTSYRLTDDLIDSLSTQADYSLGDQLFAGAFIRIEPTADVPQSIPFRSRAMTALDDNRYLTDDGQLRLQGEVPSSEMYWSVQLISAFEPARIDPASGRWVTNLDHDPSTEGFTVGNTGPGRTTSGPIKLRAAVFMEVIRDVLEAPPPFVKPRQSQKLVALSLSPDFGKRVTAHELLHAFELFHDEGIMCGGINIQDRPDGGRLTAKQVAVLRKQRGPAFSNDTRETCQ